MAAEILGLSSAPGDWLGLGATGWWIEIDGPSNAAGTSKPRVYNQSLPPSVTSVSIDIPTDNFGSMTYDASDSAAIQLPDGSRNTYVSNGNGPTTPMLLTVSTTGPYRALFRLTRFSYSDVLSDITLLKADGTTILSPTLMGVDTTPGVWFAWEADETVVVRVAGRYGRHQGVVFFDPRRAWLIDDAAVA